MPADFFFTANCCQDSVVLTVMDLAANQNSCSAGRERGQGSPNGPEAQSAELSGLTIGVIVAVVVLLVVVIAALAIIFMIRRKRNAELAEMRNMPQER